MIYVTGDVHGDFRGRFAGNVFPEQHKLCRDDVVIVCGDFGIWHDNEPERYWLKWLADKPFTVCFCDGNHENFDRLYSDEFPVVNFRGGRAHKIRDNIYHLMRGEFFDFDGKRFFVMGGASSHDIQDGILDPADFADTSACVKAYRSLTNQGKMLRIKHLSWWPEEIPSEQEMEDARIRLEEENFAVDYIISHCAPTSTVYAMGFTGSDELTDFLQYIKRMCSFKHWFFGHYHRDEEVNDKFTAIYRKIVKLEEQDEN